MTAEQNDRLPLLVEEQTHQPARSRPAGRNLRPRRTVPGPGVGAVAVAGARHPAAEQQRHVVRGIVCEPIAIAWGGGAGVAQRPRGTIPLPGLERSTEPTEQRNDALARRVVDAHDFARGWRRDARALRPRRTIPDPG